MLAAWAARLSLAGPVDEPQIGAIRYRGTVDGTWVEVWGVIDPEAMDRYVAGLR